MRSLGITIAVNVDRVDDNFIILLDDDMNPQRAKIDFDGLKTLHQEIGVLIENENRKRENNEK